MTDDRTGSCQWIGTIDDTVCGAPPDHIAVTGWRWLCSQPYNPADVDPPHSTPWGPM